MTLQLENGGAGFGVWQPVHLPKVVVVVYRDLVILAIEGTDVCGNLLQGRDGISWDISATLRVSCCRVPYTFHTRRCTVSFLQTCLASRYIPLFRGGTTESSASYLRDITTRYHDGISFEDQPILYGQVVAHAEVVVCQCWSIFLVFISFSFPCFGFGLD